MALFNPTIGIGNIAGSVGGITFSKNPYGAYVSKKDGKIKKLSTATRQQKNRFQNITAYWGQELTATEQISWNTYAQQIEYKNKIGNTFNLNGFTSFVKTNTHRLIAGLSIIETAPPIGRPETTLRVDPTGTDVYKGANQIAILYETLPDFDNSGSEQVFFIYTKPQIRYEHQKPQGTWKLLDFAISPISAGSPTWVFSIFNLTFLLTQGFYLPIQFMQMKQTGEISSKSFVNIVIQA